MNRITPETAPVGAQLLIENCDHPSYSPHEIVIVEWSPSGKFVKFRHLSGNEVWSSYLVEHGVLIEALPVKDKSPSSPDEVLVSRMADAER